MSCLLFVPAVKVEFYDKAKSLLPKLRGFVLDLEDSVCASAKDRAREVLLSHGTKLWEQCPEKTWIRINGRRSPFFADDIQLLNHLAEHNIWPSIMLPKYSSCSDIDPLKKYMQSARQRLCVNLETFSAITLVDALLTPNSLITDAAIGAEDLSAYLNIRRPTRFCDNPLFLFASGAVASACHAVGISYWGNIWPFECNEQNRINWLQEISDDIAVGATGKIAYHPWQLEDINSRFSRDADEAIAMKQKLALLEKATKEDGSLVALFEGKMIDGPEVERAKRLAERLTDAHLLAMAKHLSHEQI